jgi:hypothetical protein
MKFEDYLTRKCIQIILFLHDVEEDMSKTPCPGSAKPSITDLQFSLKGSHSTIQRSINLLLKEKILTADEGFGFGAKRTICLTPYGVEFANRLAAIRDLEVDDYQDEDGLPIEDDEEEKS